MQLVAPDILEEARLLSPFLSGTGMVVGFLLWSLGGRTHRFWLAMSVTLTAGLLGLTLGKEYGMQPLVAGLLLAVSAGALALSLVRLLLFAAGGLASLGLMHALAPAWDEPIAVFLVGGLVGVFLYRFWIITFSSLIGALILVYSALALLDRLHIVDSVAWTGKNGPLLNWGCAALVVLGILVQFLVERRRKRKAETPAEPEPEPIVVAPALHPSPAKPASTRLWAWARNGFTAAPARERIDTMRTRLLRFFAAILFVLSLSLPLATGQSDISVDRGVRLDPTAEGEKSGSSTAALPFFVMAIYTMLVLTIVCMPSRKA